MPDEKRRFNRVSFRVKAEMTVNNTLYCVEEIDNLSINGCLLPIKVDIKLETECTISIMMSGTSSELNVKVLGNVIRCDQDGVAVKFTRIDPDSLFHLRNIIRYNVPDHNIIK